MIQNVGIYVELFPKFDSHYNGGWIRNDRTVSDKQGELINKKEFLKIIMVPT